MPTIRQVSEKFEQFAPRAAGRKSDNIGLMIGNMESEVKKVLAAVDFDINTVDEAIELGADLIFTHHPLYLADMKTVTTETPIGRKLLKAIRHGINLYSAHTNLDFADGGLNDILAAKLGLTDTFGFSNKEGEPNGRCGYFGKPLSELISRAKKELDIKALRYNGDLNTLAERVGICTGGGGGFDDIDAAIEAGCDTYISGDFKYANMQYAAESGIKIIDLDHFATEISSRQCIAEFFADNFSEVEVVISKRSDSYSVAI